MSQVILYQSEDGRTKLDVRLQDQTVWLSQKQLTELFGKAKGTISEHIKHIFEDGELAEDTVVRFFRTTAAKIILSRADRSLPNMGLTHWEGARVRKPDVTIAKNYLNEAELRALNNLVEQYLIFAQSQAERRIPMTMQDWIIRLEGFLALNDREVLTHAGKVSAELAKAHAESEFTEFRRQEDRMLESDFDQALKQLPSPSAVLDKTRRSRKPKP